MREVNLSVPYDWVKCGCDKGSISIMSSEFGPNIPCVVFTVKEKQIAIELSELVAALEYLDIVKK
jgi:hypothetical protein